MFSFVGNMIVNNGAKFLADFFAVIYGAVGHAISNTIMGILSWVWNFISQHIWIVCKWVLGVLDAMQFAFSRILGLNIINGEMLSLGDYVEGMKEITVSGGSNYYDYIMQIFRTMFAVGLILMIVFTIAAIILQEYNLAITGYQKADNSKGKFVKTILSNILSIFLIPLIFYTVIIGTNSILTSFYRALGGYSDTTIAGNVLAASTYDANRYRAYANGNKRIPITISVYSMDNAFGKQKGDEELKSEIQNSEVQEKLKAIAGCFADNNFLPFEKSSAYLNGSWSNYSNYSITHNNTVYEDMGQYFENFVCTREQYYVLADFVDYCQLYGVKYYVKAMSEPDICWKYVDGLEIDTDIDADGNALKDITLNIKYRNAEKVNNPAEVVSEDANDYHSLQITTKLDLTSPISDALTTISTLLGIEESNSSFNVMERDDSGDFVNLVEWSNRKAKLQLSSGFILTDYSTWEFYDQIIIYEYFRFQNDFASTNNTLEDYTLEQLKTEGAFVDVLEMKYRNYNSNTQSYSNEHTEYCVKLNGSYYRVKESETEFDDYGQAYFELTVLADEDNNMPDYYQGALITIESNGTKALKLSSNFNINNIAKYLDGTLTGANDWQIQDQILLYEYFKDLSLSNGIRRTNKFSDFSTGSGVTFNRYKIGGTDYLYINGTYYETDNSGNLKDDKDFLIYTAAANERWFEFSTISGAEKYGIDQVNLNSIIKIVDPDSQPTVLGESDAMYQKYITTNLKFSKNFSFYNTDTWTFRDYAIMYIYANYLAEDSSVTITTLQIQGLSGDIIKATFNGSLGYYLHIKYKDNGGGDKNCYVNLDSFTIIPEQLINTSISSTQFNDLGLGVSTFDFVKYYDASDILINPNSSVKVSSKQFELSENFDAYDARTWSVGDFLMLYLIEADVVSTTIDLVKQNGYSSLCYTIDGKKYYRFGRQGDQGAKNAFFLDENKLNNMGYTIEKWFNANLISFLLATKYTGYNISDLVVEDEDFANGTSTNAGNYLYNINSSITDARNLQRKLAQQFLLSDLVVQDVSEMEYSYSNPSITPSDPSTWSVLDLLIFSERGSLPTVDNPYVSYLYSDGSNTYLHMKQSDKFVKINDGVTKCYSSSSILTHRIKSNNATQFLVNEEFQSYYNSKLAGMVTTTLSETTPDGKCYYYSQFYKSNTGDLLNLMRSDFDFILAKYNVSSQSTGFFTFNLHIVDGAFYVEISTDTYVRLSSSTSALVYCEEGALVSFQTKAFTKESTHTAFNGIDSVDEYSRLDSYIYSLTGSVSLNAEYPIYKSHTDVSSGDKFIFVANKFIKYTSDDVSAKTVFESNTTPISNLQIQLLYNNFYSSYINTETPIIKEEYAGSLLPGIENNGELKDVHGLAVICRYFGFTDIILSTVSYSIVEASNGKYYLKINPSSGVKYIDVSNLLEVIPRRQNGNVLRVDINVSSKGKEDFRWAFARLNTTPSYTNPSYISIKSSLYANSTVSNNSVLTLDEGIETAREKASSETAFSEWSWLGLISNYILPSVPPLAVVGDPDVEAQRAKYNVYKYYVIGDGEYYYFKGQGISVFVKNQIGSFGLEDKISDDTVNRTYKRIDSPSISANSNLAKILQSLNFDVATSVKNSFKETTFTVSQLDEFYIILKDGNYYAIYGLPQAEDAVVSTGLQCVKVDGSGSPDAELVDEGQGSLFIFKSLEIEQVEKWTMFDLIVAYSTGTVLGTAFSSKIYVFNNKHYIQHQGRFIVLPLLSGNGINGVVDYNSGNPIILNNGTNEYEPATADTYMDGLIQLIRNESEAEKTLHKRTELSGVDGFESSLTSTTDKPFQRLNFSDNFDYSDYTTWTYSDFVIYYAFVNGYYDCGCTDLNTCVCADHNICIADGVEYELPFNYVPTFGYSGGNYFNVTYLDIILAKIFGATNPSPSPGEIPVYKYLTGVNTQASYNFVLGSSGGSYYLKFITSGGAEHYIPLSADISVEFKKMNVSSLELKPLMNATEIHKKVEEFTTVSTKYYLISAPTGFTPLKTSFLKENFQTFVNSNCAPVQVYYLLDQNAGTGSVEVSKVINFAFSSCGGHTGEYFDYDKFYDFYKEFLSHNLSLVTKPDEESLSVKVYASEPTPSGTLVAKLKYEGIYPDLVFDDYYYFTLNTTIFRNSNIHSVDSNFEQAIRDNKVSQTSLEEKIVNLRLSANFEITDPSTWTLLDFIIIYELSRDDVRRNIFKGMTINELKNSDYYYTVYYFDDDNDELVSDGSNYNDDPIYLYVNNNFYKLTGIVEWNTTDKIFKGKTNKISTYHTTNKFNAGTEIDTQLVELNGLVGTGTINAYDFKVLFDSYEISINPAYTYSRQLVRNKNNTMFKDNDKTYYIELDTNVSDVNYRINVASFGKYSTTALVKKSSWVEKLMTDMQVYYPDLNWGVLLATDGWLDTLGEFTSAQTSGLFTGGQNSSNTTAPGLVLAEFFMSVATEVEGGHAEYEYSSAFDKDTIRALMLSLMGEENYQALVFEAEVFMDYFNSCFAPIIDDFAKEFGESVNENSLRLNAYKSYLATLLLSSDIGEYLYTIATRVYAEYTIGEYLAAAAGDSLGYYNYANQLRDEDGNLVEAFNYGSFIELVRYENKYCGDNNPVFTFNFRKAFDKFKDGSGKVNGFTLTQALNTDYIFDYVARVLFNKIDKEYESKYKVGYSVNEYGNLINKNGEEKSKDGEYIYCYMLHVYHHIYQEVGEENDVVYLNCYRQYLDGNLSRWTMIKGQNIQTADQYIETYEKTKSERELYKFLTVTNSAFLLIPRITLEDTANTTIANTLLDKFKNFVDSVNISLPYYAADDIITDTELKKDLHFVKDNLISIFATMLYSEDSDDPNQTVSSVLKDFAGKFLPVDINPNSCWNTIKRYYEAICNVTDELQDVRGLLPGEETDKGSLRKASYSDDKLNVIVTAFVNVRTNLEKYIAAQERIDMIKKKSVTFTLAQYASNYVTSGYKFSVKNKEYTFKPETDPVRLAEYVYGGAFLEEVGEGSKYTDPEFTGIIKANKVYDNEDKVIKTNLDSWKELRGFLSKIADQTAELYFLTNLGDLDISTTNKILLKDSINISGTITGESIFANCDSSTSIEEALYTLMASNIDMRIVYRLLGLDYDETDPAGNSLPAYTDSNVGHNGFVTLTLYTFGGNVPEEAFDNMTLEEFKRYAVKQIIRNEQNQAESAEERAAKYMLVYSILGVQVDLYAGSTQLKRKLYGSRVDKSGPNVKYDSTEITGTISLSNSTLDSVKVLSGLENRPTREILTRQYAGIRPGDYFDEAYGDIFIACTYKDGLYYPIQGSASRNVSTADCPRYNDYLSSGEFITHKFISNYYDNKANLVVMKGIITADGYPTAIRKYNNPIELSEKQLFKVTTKVYSPVAYYRTNVGANFGEGKDLVDASKAVGRITTKNYTQYVVGTSFTKGIGSNVTYTGRTNMKTTVHSDYGAKFVQAKAEYLMGQADDFGAVSVIDDFSYFYLFNSQTWMLLLLAFVTIIPAMINALGGAVARVLDILVLFLVSPIVISTNSLYAGGKNNIYKKWRKNVETVAMGAFGYILAFSTFSLLVPMVYGVNSFVGYDTFTKIASIGGIGFITYPMVNGFVRALWVITAATLIEKLPKLLLPIITANRGDIQSPDPGLGSGAGKKFTDKMKDVVKAAKDVKNVLNGSAALGLMKELKDEALNIMPGYNLAKAAAQPFIDKAKKQKTDKESEYIEKRLKEYGIDPKVAKEAGKAVKDAEAAKKKTKESNKKRMDGYKKDFMSVLDMK